MDVEDALDASPALKIKTAELLGYSGNNPHLGDKDKGMALESPAKRRPELNIELYDYAKSVQSARRRLAQITEKFAKALVKLRIPNAERVTADIITLSERERGAWNARREADSDGREAAKDVQEVALGNLQAALDAKGMKTTTTHFVALESASVALRDAIYREELAKESRA